MTITKIFAHLVYPNHRGDVPVPFTASELALDGKLFGMLKEVYDGSPKECNIDIAFRTDDQSHEVRQLILDFISKKDATSAGRIAHRLAAKTTRRSQLGLFFVIHGQDNKKDIVLLSRFPTDQAILADDGSGNLSVEFLEKVFVKKWSSYKGAFFIDTVGNSGFWEGRVVDRQINAPTGEASKYWVDDFLDAYFLTTSALGSRRFAAAISDASKGASISAKQELNSLIPFLKQFDNKAVSPSEILDKIGVSDDARDRIARHLPSNTYDQTFKFSFDSLRNNLTFRTVVLDNGVSLTADSADFQDLVSITPTDAGSDMRVTLSATGKLIGDQLRKAR
jgi:hypothetical protein